MRNLLTSIGATVYRENIPAYTSPVGLTLHIGHAIRIAREQRGWNQARLGQEAAKFRIEPDDGEINVNTVSSVEREPYNSKHGTIWRLMLALNLSLADVEHVIGPSHRPPESHAARGKPQPGQERRSPNRKRSA
jgi:transcriptional regulator with XRE-family HTH domain